MSEYFVKVTTPQELHALCCNFTGMISTQNSVEFEIYHSVPFWTFEIAEHQASLFIPAKPLHNRDIVSLHFDHFPCMTICDKP